MVGPPPTPPAGCPAAHSCLHWGWGVHSCVTSAGRLLSFFIHKLSTADWLVKRPERRTLPLPSSNLPITRRQILGAAITPPALSHTHIRLLLLWNDTFVGINIFSLFLHKARITLFPIPQVQMAVMLGIVDKIIRTANSSLQGQNNPIL